MWICKTWERCKKVRCWPHYSLASIGRATWRQRLLYLRKWRILNPCSLLSLLSIALRQWPLSSWKKCFSGPHVSQPMAYLSSLSSLAPYFFLLLRWGDAIYCSSPWCSRQGVSHFLWVFYLTSHSWHQFYVWLISCCKGQRQMRRGGHSKDTLEL